MDPATDPPPNVPNAPNPHFARPFRANAGYDDHNDMVNAPMIAGLRQLLYRDAQAHIDSQVRIEVQGYQLAQQTREKAELEVAFLTMARMLGGQQRAMRDQPMQLEPAELKNALRRSEEVNARLRAGETQEAKVGKDHAADQTVQHVSQQPEPGQKTDNKSANTSFAGFSDSTLNESENSNPEEGEISSESGEEWPSLSSSYTSQQNGLSYISRFVKTNSAVESDALAFRDPVSNEESAGPSSSWSSKAESKLSQAPIGAPTAPRAFGHHPPHERSQVSSSEAAVEPIVSSPEDSERHPYERSYARRSFPGRSPRLPAFPIEGGDDVPAFFKYGIQYKPSPDETDIYRTVIISNLPQTANYENVLKKIRGGGVLQLHLLKTWPITKDETRTAMVTFVHQEAAVAYATFARTNPITFVGMRAEVTLLKTPTWPIPPYIRTAIDIWGWTRCFEIHNFPYVPRSVPHLPSPPPSIAPT